MPIFELTRDALKPIDQVPLASQGIRERQDLQRVLKANIEAVSPDTYVLAEEYREWEDSKRSIDLLGLDKSANLVVIELKRTEDGGHMELQAIRYAAMVSKMRFEQAVDAHEKFLKSSREEAEKSILDFLEWEEPQLGEFAKDVRIVLVSADFSKEITTSVIWLNEYDLDIRCVRMRPYRLGEKTLLDIQQVVPLPEAAEYQVKLRLKASEQRQENTAGSDWSRYELRIGNEIYRDLYKRQLFLHAIRALVDSGVSVDELLETFANRRFLGIKGRLNSKEFCKAAAKVRTATGKLTDLRRYFTDDGELFYSNGTTWALHKQWSIHQLQYLDQVIAKYPQARISYSKISET